MFRKKSHAGEAARRSSPRSRPAWWRWRPAPARITGRARLAELGHTVRLIPPAYVKPFVKRQKNDAADAEAICEAAQRPTMRFVAVKSEEQQATASCSGLGICWCASARRCINAFAGTSPSTAMSCPRASACRNAWSIRSKIPLHSLPDDARTILRVLVSTFNALDDADRASSTREIDRRAKADPVARRLMTIPGIGPITATAITALAPAPETFGPGATSPPGSASRRCRTRPAASRSSAPISKMGERTIRRLLILGASAVIRQALLRGAPAGSWLAQMLARKPRMLVTVALANKMARIVWALLVKGGVYRAPVAGGVSRPRPRGVEA